MSREDQATWDNAVALYDREFAAKSLLFDRGMIAIKLGLADRDDSLTGAPFDDELKTLLLSAAPIYRKYVVRVAQYQGAYTSTNPTHIVVASADPSYDGFGSTEMLFHESSHALIMKVETAVNAALKQSNKQANDLWHVVLFYVAGEVTRQQLAASGIDYKPYLYSTGLFDRAWPRYRVPVETHVPPYIDGKITLEEMAANLAAAVP